MTPYFSPLNPVMALLSLFQNLKTIKMIQETVKMRKITPPKVRILARGTNLTAKQMQGKAGDLMPKHLADVESIVFVHEGECLFHMNGEVTPLKAGDSLVVPPETKHQIEVVADFKGVHFMPKDIKFQFFK